MFRGGKTRYILRYGKFEFYHSAAAALLTSIIYRKLVCEERTPDQGHRRLIHTSAA